MEKMGTKHKNHWPLQNTFYGFDICNIRYYLIMVSPIILQHRQITAGFLPQRPWFNPIVSHVGFIVDKVALQHFRFPLTTVNLPRLNTKLRAAITMIKQGQKNAT